MTEIKAEPFTKEEEEALNFCLEDKVHELLADDMKKKLDKEILGKETKDTRKILDSGAMNLKDFYMGRIKNIY